MAESPKQPQVKKKSASSFWTICSGLIYGAGDDDPSAIGSYSQIGAQSGTSLLWLLLISTPMLSVVQTTVAKFGAVTHKGLSKLLKEQYSMRVALFAAVLIGIANIATLGADIAGTATGVTLLLPVHWHFSWKWFVIPLTLGLWALEVFGAYKVIKNIFIAFAFLLISYIFAGLMAHPNWPHVLRDTFLPAIHMNGEYFTAAVGLLGATISPYMFYFQEAEEVEDKVTAKDLDGVNTQTIVGMVFSNVVGYFVILSVAAVQIAHHGKLHIDTAAQAAEALKPLAGNWAGVILGLGLVGAGLLAIPVLAAATATMIGEIFDWRVGLNQKPTRAKLYYRTLSLTLLLGVIVSLSGINPIKALYWSQILSGVVSPFLLFLIFRLAAKKEMLGKYTNTKIQQSWGWLTFSVMIIAVALMVKSWF